LGKQDKNLTGQACSTKRGHRFAIKLPGASLVTLFLPARLARHRERSSEAGEGFAGRKVCVRLWPNLISALRKAMMNLYILFAFW